MAAADVSAPACHPAQLPDAKRELSGELQLDLAAYELRRGEARVDLPPREMVLLILLVGNQGKLVTRLEIQHAVWPENPPAKLDTSINTLVRRLRRALGDNSLE